MLRSSLALSVVAFALFATAEAAQAQHELPYEFDGTHVALSIERFMGIDYTDYETGPSDVSARLLLNANEPAITNFARFGVDVFIERLSLGIAGGVATPLAGDDIGIVTARVGYLVGLTAELGLWLRGGVFYGANFPADYIGVTAEALFSWFPYSFLAFTFGPTLDAGFAQDDVPADYVSIGIPELGMTAFF